MLEAHRVGRLPELFYIPDFVSVEDENRLLDAIVSSKAPWIQA